MDLGESVYNQCICATGQLSKVKCRPTKTEPINWGLHGTSKITDDKTRPCKFVEFASAINFHFIVLSGFRRSQESQTEPAVFGPTQLTVKQATGAVLLIFSGADIWPLSYKCAQSTVHVFFINPYRGHQPRQEPEARSRSLSFCHYCLFAYSSILPIYRPFLGHPTIVN